MVKRNKGYMQLVNQSDDKAELYIYGDIVDYSWWEEDISAQNIKSQLEELTVSEINVHINSYGGDVFSGIAIYNLLKQHPAKINVYIDSCACSIASVIAMAGDTIKMPKNTLMMIHNCWTWAVGNSKALRKTADDMDVIMNASVESYLSKIKITKEKLIELLDAETWLTAEECVEMGFADEVIPLNEEESVMQSATLFKLVQKVKEMDAPNRPESTIEEEKIDEVKEVEETETIETKVEEKTTNFVNELLKKIGGE